jgi:hypothetical protein
LSSSDSSLQRPLAGCSKRILHACSRQQPGSHCGNRTTVVWLREFALEDKLRVFTSATRNVRSTKRAMNRKSLVEVVGNRLLFVASNCQQSMACDKRQKIYTAATRRWNDEIVSLALATTLSCVFGGGAIQAQLPYLLTAICRWFSCMPRLYKVFR